MGTARRLITVGFIFVASNLIHTTAPASASEHASTSPDDTELVDSLIVQRLPGRSAAEARRFVESTTDLDTSRGRAMSDRYELIELDEPVTRSEARMIAQRLESKGLVTSASPNSRRYINTAPNDTKYSDQWYLKPYSTNFGIDIETAWDHTIGVASTVVAVIDTGVLFGHPDLAGRAINGYDFLDNDTDATDPGDADPANTCGGLGTNSWHGTHVSGIISAGVNNAVGVAGINKAAPVLGIRILGRCGGSVFDEARAVRWAAGLEVAGVPTNPNPAKVINLSLGSPDVCTSAEQDAINAAVNAGAVVVVAAGNDQLDIDKHDYAPANCQNVITVGAITKTGGLSAYSNYGSSLDVSAPGNEILSTIGLDSPPGTFSGYGYGTKSGTSMASPIVAGVVSLILAANPSLPSRDIELLIESTASPFPAGSSCSSYFGNGLPYCGSGIVNASAAVHAAAGFDPVSTITAVTPTRVLDTRSGIGGVAVSRVGDGTENAAPLSYQILGQANIPASGVAAISMNVTVANTNSYGGTGYVSVYPCSSGKPYVSNLNFVTSQVVPNTVIVPVNGSTTCFFVYGTADLIVDVNGYFNAGAGFNPVTPARVADTRSGFGVPVGRIGNLIDGQSNGRDTLNFTIAGTGGVPSGAAAVSLNVTAVNTTDSDGNGYVSVYPCLGGRPDVSNLNFSTRQVVPNAVIVPVDANGNICLFVYGKSDLIIDVNGWFAAGSGFTTVAPRRVVDTRSGIGGVAVSSVGNGSPVGSVLDFRIAGAGGVAQTGVTAVSLNVTVANTVVDGGGYVTVYPCWGLRPTVSNLNFVTNQVVPNAVIVPVDDNGHLCFYVYGRADLIVDVNGYFSG